jgi:ubiquinone/menaquinone biosynthesis C-methylase UbiE
MHICESLSLCPLKRRELFHYNQKMLDSVRRLILRIILWGFNLLYHQFAWMYDFAAWLVSAGRWDDWIRSTIDLIAEGPLLDIGCGQGVLLEQANLANITAFGLDESPQMLHRSQKRQPSGNASLIRGLGQAIPFATASFTTITATFPAPYLFEPTTLKEINRVLAPDGSLIILLTAMVTGNSLRERLIRLSGNFFGFGQPPESTLQRLFKPLQQAGFDGTIRVIETNNSRLYFLLGQSRQTK